MTDFDKKFIEKATNFSRWDYQKIDVLISIADTSNAKQELRIIRHELYESVRETI